MYVTKAIFSCDLRDFQYPFVCVTYFRIVGIMFHSATRQVLVESITSTHGICFHLRSQIPPSFTYALCDVIKFSETAEQMLILAHAKLFPAITYTHVSPSFLRVILCFPAISNFSRHLKHSQMLKHWLQKSRDKELARMCPALVWVYMLKEYSAFSSLLRDDTITSNYNTSFLNC